MSFKKKKTNALNSLMCSKRLETKANQNETLEKYCIKTVTNSYWLKALEILNVSDLLGYNSS
jgi:hypothetical protein